MINSLPDFYKNKKVLITGHTGFKGSWLSLWLRLMGANICGISLEPYTQKDIFNLCRLEQVIQHHIQDITDFNKTNEILSNFRPDIIFHLAAQPIVRISYEEPLKTFQTNVMGTVNILECCRRYQNKLIIIVVTSDKCYENKKRDSGYLEDDPLGGHDPYSASKGATEIIAHSYRRSFFQHDNNPFGKSLATGRAGNVIGGGDWQIDRLIPDFIRSIEKNIPMKVRYPQAVRPWQHVLEPISGYLHLAKSLSEQPEIFADAWNFGPDSSAIKTVEEVITSAVKSYGSGTWESENNLNPHETEVLLLDNSKAKRILNWYPIWDFETTIHRTIEWYKQYPQGNMREFSEEQISCYIQSFSELKLN